MVNLIVTWLFSAAVLFFTSQAVEGFELPNISSALFVCILIGLINVFIRPLISLLALPINLVSLGLFSFGINAVVLKLVAIDGWSGTFFAAIFLAAIQLLTNMLLPGTRQFLGRY